MNVSVCNVVQLTMDLLYEKFFLKKSQYQTVVISILVIGQEVMIGTQNNIDNHHCLWLPIITR